MHDLFDPASLLPLSMTTEQNADEDFMPGQSDTGEDPRTQQDLAERVAELLKQPYQTQQQDASQLSTNSLPRQDSAAAVQAKASSKKKYQGKWSTTITGSKAHDKEALKPTAPKNNSSRPEDKLWDCTHHPKPILRSKAKSKGIDVDDPSQVDDFLTLRFSLKSDPATRKEIVYEPPADWDDQEELTSLIKTITQHRRREAGVKAETRHIYTAEEKAFLARHFEENEGMQGESGMSKNEKWEGLAGLFNERFRGRKSRIASKGGKDVDVGNRSWHAIMALCDRDEGIRRARKVSEGGARAGAKRSVEQVDGARDGDTGVAGGDDGVEEGGDQVIAARPIKRRRGRPSKVDAQ